MKAFVALLLMTVCSVYSHAALQALSDDELSNQTGQAFLQIDRDTHGSIDFTKFTFGMDVDISMNADLVELGRYERDGEAVGSSDIRINDFALGSVNGDGSLNPFHITDPFFELAFENVNGKEELVGIRLGFGSALGKLSGNIEYLTGNIEVKVAGTAAPIIDQADPGQQFLLWLAGVNDSTELEAGAELVTASGDPDAIRAQWIGVKNGDTLGCPSGGGNCSGWTGGLLSLFSSGNCAVLGIATCFPLSNFRTLDIGSGNNAASGMFISFQTKSISWFDNGEATPTVSGAFMNIPNGGITVDFEQSFNGIERIRTKFLDPYYD